MSWLKILNVFLLQWFFIRLTRCSEVIEKEVPCGIIITNVDGTPAKLFGKEIPQTYMVKINKQWYSIQGFILPVSGWSSDFKYLNNPFFIKISKTKFSEVPVNIDTLTYEE